VQFTDAEAGLKRVPRLNSRQFNYSRRPSVANALRGRDRRGPADTRHYCRRAGCTRSPRHRRLPAGLDGAEGVGQRPPRAQSGSPLRGKGYDWPAHGWHEFRDPNEEWELTCPLQRERGAPAQPERRRGPAVQGLRGVERQLGAVSWSAMSARGCTSTRPGPVTCSPTPTGAGDQHAQYGDRRQQHAPDPLSAGPGAVQPHAVRGDRRLRRTAHQQTWNNDPAWQGVREVAEQLTAVDDWPRRSSAAQCGVRALVGELFRSHLCSTPRRARRLRDPTIVRRGGVRPSPSGTCANDPHVRLLTDRSRVRGAEQASCGLAVGLVPRAITACPPRCSACGHSPTRCRRASKMAWRRQERFAGILTDISLDTRRSSAHDRAAVQDREPVQGE